MEEIELTTSRLMRIYWAMLWRQIVGGFVVGLVGGFVVGFIAAFLGFGRLNATLGALVGLVGGFVWMAFVIRMILKKRYRDFRIILVAVPTTIAAATQAQPDSNAPSEALEIVGPA